MIAPRVGDAGFARRGMTLMEVVVALVILGVVAAIGTTAFSTLIDHRKLVRDATVSTERAAALRGMVRSWLAAGTVNVQQGGGPRVGRQAAAARTTASSTTNASTTSAQGSGDELSVTTSAPSPAMQADVRLRLYVDIDPNTPEQGLSVEYQRSTASPLERRMLDSTIDSLSVEYLDNRTNQWVASAQVATIQPRALRVTFLTASGKPVPSLLTAPIVAAVGNTAALTAQGLMSGRGGR